MYINDVVLHVDEALDPSARRALEDEIRAIEGVIAPRFSDMKPHLMIIAYDPDRLRAIDLLNTVRSRGYHAEHCGA